MQTPPTMETPGTGSDSAMDSTDASTSDSSSSDGSPSAQISTSLNELFHTPIEMTTTKAIDEGNDSASDVSMSADTDDEDDEEFDNPIIQVNPGVNVHGKPAPLVIWEPVDSISQKRKYLEPTEGNPNGETSNGPSQEDRKRLKADGDVNEKYTNSGDSSHQPQFLLPAEIWHHIFTFIPPRSLASLLQVNKTFNAYLDPSSPNQSITPASKSAVQILKPDSIWRASRRLFWSGMPAPLQGKSELDMWKLACAFSCQFCGKKQPSLTMPSDQYHPGPGENGLVSIWSFGVHSCGPCLQAQSSKEIDLFLSSSVPSQLMTALPFVFLTNELHILPLATVQSGQAPQTLSISKVFFQPQIEDIQKEFMEVKSMGTATVEEWMKGLDDLGKERRSDAARWVNWEAAGGVSRMRSPEDSVKNGPQLNNSATLSSTNLGAATTNGHIQGFQAHNPTQAPTQAFPHMPQPIQLPFPPSGPPRYDSPSQNGFTPYPPRTYPQVRHERSKEEVAELKAARRAEIERRCMLLDPPLTPDVLAHMGSFQAAIQIIQPLNEGAWEVLKPRLLSQRDDAEQREKERIAQTRVAQEQLSNYPDAAQVKSESKDPYDRDWDIQAPLRARIGGYADETIKDGWTCGEKVSKDNCSTFAAEVLLYVRKRFYAEVAKNDASLRATGREPEMDPPDGPSSRKLTLENMKWVFDTKIRPHTEQYRKELFLCNDCEVSKPYGFEGVIQHYAAKHTNALSMGTIVVHWKSEWPEYPPFDPEPTTGKNSYYATAPSASAPYTSAAPQQSYGYGAYQPAPVSAPMPAPNPQVYQESPGPYYGHPQFGDQYAAQQNGPYAPPQPYQDTSQSYQTPQYSVPPAAVSNLGYSDPSQEYSQGYSSQYPAAAQGYYNHQQHQGTMYPTSMPEVSNQQSTYNPLDGQYGYAYSQPPVPQPTTSTQPPPKTEEYKAQLLDVANNARDVWDSIHGLKEVPGSVKVYTIIFHLLKRSRFRFPEDPPLTMIADGLSSNKDMRKVRNVNGLLCKACTLGLAGASAAPQKKHFSFPQLVKHFHSTHEFDTSHNGYNHSLDWTKDMIELPDQSRLSLIPKTPGMTDQMLKLIAEAIPEIFAARQETPEYVTHTEQPTRYEQPAYQDPYDPPPSQDNHDKYYATVDNGRASEPDSVPYDNTQYDPRNPRDLHQPHIQEDSPPRYRVLQRAEDYYPQTHQERVYARPRALTPVSRTRPTEGYQRLLVRDEAPMYLDEQPRYRDEANVEYRVRRAPPSVAYETVNSTAPDRDYRDANSQGYQANRREAMIPITHDAPTREIRYLPSEDAAIQQSRVHEVVAQISQQAQQARENPVREDPADGGSEDGELRAASISHPVASNGRTQESEASNAAERFLSEFLPGDSVGESADKDREVSRYENEHGDGLLRMYQPQVEPRRRVRDGYEEDERAVRGRPLGSAHEEHIPNGYVLRDRSPQAMKIRTYSYDERYMNSAPGQTQTAMRERSPELVDRRFKLNNVVYRDERQNSHGMRRTPSSRYARYESVRLENDRARSRSPVYVKMGSQPGQYRERSPGAHTSPQEPIYRTRTPQAPVEELAYERAPRPEYYRVYADEPPARQPQFEYVRVSDPQGDYMLRRPVRREPEPIYAAYEGDSYPRQPVYESRAPAPRPDTAYYEEYDPRHPAPPPPTAATSVRQVRYQ